MLETLKRAEDADPVEAQAERRARVLVVDDDTVILATLEAGLHDAGYDVSVAASAKEAISTVMESLPSLAILDVRMPGMDGIELAGHLREHTSVPILFLSAYGDLPLVRGAVGQGALGYLLKPIDIPELIPSIEAALERGKELARLRETENRLTAALVTAQTTRTAVGVLMERQRLDQQSAFEALRRHARSQRRKIAEVAQDVLSAAEALNIPPVGNQEDR